LARLLWSGLAIAAVIAFDLRLPALLIAAAALAALYPRTAVLVWIASAAVLLVPLYQMRHSAVYLSTAYLTLLLAGAASDAVLQRGTWRVPRSLSAPLLAVAVVAVVAGIQGALLYDPTVPGVHRFALMQVYATALIVLSVAAPLLVAYRLDDVRTLMPILIAVGAYAAIRPMLVQNDEVGAGWRVMVFIQAMALAYAALLRWPPRSFWLRSLAAASVVYGLGAYLVLPLVQHNSSQWVSAWMALTVSIAVISWVHFRTLRWRLLIPAAAATVVAFWPFIQRAVENASREGDFGRIYIWADAMRLWMLRPLLGVGPGNYIDYIERYATHHRYGSAHGNYQQVAADMGALGLAAVLWALGMALSLALRQRRSADPAVAAFALGALGALSGQMAAAVVGDYLLPAYHNAGHSTICVTVYFWILIGGLMATATHSRVPPPSSATRESALPAATEHPAARRVGG
jgi:hypothetical protein